MKRIILYICVALLTYSIGLILAGGFGHLLSDWWEAATGCGSVFTVCLT